MSLQFLRLDNSRLLPRLLLCLNPLQQRPLTLQLGQLCMVRRP